MLVDWQIDFLCRMGMVTPYDPSLLNPASLDIRLGDTAKLRQSGDWLTVHLGRFSESAPFVLQPNDRLLVASLEEFSLPPFVCAQFFLKSSRAREFLEHLHAGFCDPGWHGSKLTMELVNMDTVPKSLYPGMRIGQMIFSLTMGIPVKDYSKTGRYNGDKFVSGSKDNGQII